MSFRVLNIAMDGLHFQGLKNVSANRLQMRQEIKINLKPIRTEKDFHDLVAKSFLFPSYYGRNKDAFWDCLTDLAEPIMVEISGEKDLTLEMKAFVDSYLDILNEYEQETGGKFKVIRTDPATWNG